MPKGPKKLVDLQIDEVAGVDSPANMRKFLVIKRADTKPTLRERIASLFKADSEVVPKSFDQALAGTKLDDTWWQLNDALRTSLRSIVESEADNKGDLIRASVAQYAEKIIAVAGEAGENAEATAKMQKMHDALIRLGEADGTDLFAKVDEVESVAKSWRETLEKGSGDMPKLDELLKDASQEVRDAVKAALEKRDTDLADLQAKVDELSKGEGGDDGPDDINKADLPEPVRKRLEDLEKKAAIAEQLAKSERETRIMGEIRKRAEGYSNAGPVDDLTDMIYKAHDVSKEYGEKVEATLKAAHERVEKGALFDEFGSRGGRVDDDPQAQFADAVDKYVEEKNVDYGTAAREVMKRNPELAKAYQDDIAVGRS